MRTKKTRLPEISGELAENILDLIDREGFTSFREMLTVLNFKVRKGEMCFTATPSAPQYRPDTNNLSPVIEGGYSAQYLNGTVTERFDDEDDEDD